MISRVRHTVLVTAAGLCLAGAACALPNDTSDKAPGGLMKLDMDQLSTVPLGNVRLGTYGLLRLGPLRHRWSDSTGCGPRLRPRPRS